MSGIVFQQSTAGLVHHSLLHMQELVKKMSGREPNVTVNPDEVVALGAAVQAGGCTCLVELGCWDHAWLGFVAWDDCSVHSSWLHK